MKFAIPCLIIIMSFTALSQNAQQNIDPPSSISIKTGDIETRGSCSSVAITPNGSITIKCITSGLSKDEAEKLSKQYVTILNSIKEYGLKEDQILKLVQQIANGMHQITETNKDRTLNKEQHDILINKLKYINDTNMLIIVMPGGDNRAYAEYYIQLFTKELNWKSTRAEFGVTDVPTKGTYFYISQEDQDAHSVPQGCVDSAVALWQLHLVDEIIFSKENLDHNNNLLTTPRGSCILYISQRKTKPQ